MQIPSFSEIKIAYKRIKNYIHNTPVLSSNSINIICGAEIFFKCENFQKIGAFKIRGATNAIFSLSNEDAEKGVATHSSGNHAQALALAAKWRGIKSYVVMPKNSPQVKINAVRGYGAEITFCEPNLMARENGLSKVVEKTGATFIHPYDNYNVICGQGTAALEFLKKVPNPDIIMTPVGGGGLLSGTAITVSTISDKIKIIAGEPAGADDAFRSFKSGKLILQTNPQTIADGLLTSLSDLTFHIITKLVDDILTVKEENIKKAMQLIWERMKIIVEPSAAVPLGAILENPELFSDKKIGIILSGGNVDLEKLPW